MGTTSHQLRQRVARRGSAVARVVLSGTGLALVAAVSLIGGNLLIAAANPGETRTASEDGAELSQESGTAIVVPPSIATFRGGERDQDHAVPALDFNKGVSVGTATDLAINWRGILRPDRAAYEFVSARGVQVPSGAFVIDATYRGLDGKAISVGSWTPTKQVEVSLPDGSPVHEATEFQVAGHQVIMITPTANVIDGAGLHRAYIVGDRAVHLVDGIGFTARDDFLGLVTGMAMEGELE